MLPSVMFLKQHLTLRLISRQLSQLVPMLHGVLTLKDRVAVGNSPQSLLIPEIYLEVSGELLGDPGQYHHHEF